MKKSILLLVLLTFGRFFSQSDCSTAVPICGGSTISYTPSNNGNVPEPLNGCLSIEHFTVWYTFTVATSGTLTMDLIPNGNTDYDWAIWGPNTNCGNLGTPIRCSYAATGGSNYNTGMNMTETDLSESASGNGYVQYMNVVAGQTYTLLIDNFSSSSFGFVLTWGGTATLASAFTPELQPFPFVPPGNPGPTTTSPREIPICTVPTLFNFQTLTPGILNGNTNFTVSYHYLANNAILNTNPITTPINVNSGQTFYYRIAYFNPLDPNDPKSKCFQVGAVKFVLSNVANNVVNKTLTQCPPITNVLPIWDLTSAAVYTGTSAITKSYHLSLADAQANINPIANPATYAAAAPKDIFVRVKENLSGCIAYTKISLAYFPSPNATNVTLSQCQNVGGPWIFNLTTAAVTNSTANTVQYFTTLAGAQAGTNPIATPTNYTVSAPGTSVLYALVKTPNQCSGIAEITLKANENPVLTTTSMKACNVNGQGTFNLTSAVVSTQTGLTYTYFTSLANAQNNTSPIQTVGAFVSTPTVVFVRGTTTSGCYSIVPITLELYDLPVVNLTAYNLKPCDNNLDGIIEVNFNDVTTATVTNASIFTVKYYLSQAEATAGSGTSLPTNWSYSTPTTVYMSIQSPNGCAPVVKVLNFGFGNSVAITTPITKEICDEDLDGIINVDINSFNSSFTTETGVTIKYFATLVNAQNNTNPIAGTVTVNQTGTYYVRFEKAGLCPSLGRLTIRVKTSKASEQLKTKYICINQTTSLDAGPGFTSYLWNTGATTQILTNVPVGTYTVKLGFNGCFYTQRVEVLAAPDPVITEVKIDNNKIEIIVSGGNPPYQYSLDGVVWQQSNIFTNLPRGENKIYVRDSNKCIPVPYSFTILNLTNAITPNGDGYNDYLDYSALIYKKDLKLSVFDRYGKQVFSSEDSKEFKWDGKYQGRVLNTGTYWYILTFTENDTKGTPVKYSGWVMIKNRD